MALPSPFRRSVTGKVSIVAHRGLSTEEPENTMRSFRRAAEVGCDLIELDLAAGALVFLRQHGLL